MASLPIGKPIHGANRSMQLEVLVGATNYKPGVIEMGNQAVGL